MQRQLAVIPVIAKSDTLTDPEIAAYRAELKRTLDEEGIAYYDFGEGEATETDPLFLSRGRQRSEPLAIVARDGAYPWGEALAWHQQQLKHKFSLVSGDRFPPPVL